ncbi:MAG: hypothetical protein L3J39_06075 [Verrucomicrobiales bacterium]|nr:hypothetical protein [Verrucomicrobiales bacterium]
MAAVRNRRKKNKEHSAFDLLEQAFHALRTAPTGLLAIYYLGAVPFVISLFYFWADMSRSSFALRDAALASLVVAGFYLCMKVCQAIFCRQMWQQLNAGGELPHLSAKRSLRYLVAQALIQATALPVLILSLITLIPLAWVYAFYQNVSALALTQDYGKRPLRHLLIDAARQSHWAWGVNHTLIAVLAVFCLFVWMSVMMAALYLPMLAKMLLGVESVFTLNPVATLMNSTFLFGTLLLVFLCVSPLTKTLYVIRCFYGQSRSSGADLLSRLAALQNEQAAERGEIAGQGVGYLKVAVMALLLLGAGSAKAQEEVDEVPSTRAAVKTVEASDFEAAVQETLQQTHFQWRLSREQLENGDQDKSEGFVSGLLKSLVASIKEGFKSVEDLLDRLFNGKSEKRSAGDFKGFGSMGEIASISLVVLLVIMLAAVITIIVRRRRQMGVVEAEAEVVEPIDLESEQVLASQLPEDEWMKMAREKIEKGEYRLAIRALFLASLAHLGERDLLKVARFKSNRDYRGELSLKARSMPQVIEAFGENVSLFEWVWYGLHDIGGEAVERFTDNYEKITQLTSPVSGVGNKEKVGREDHAS